MTPRLAQLTRKSTRKNKKKSVGVLRNRKRNKNKASEFSATANEAKTRRRSSPQTQKIKKMGVGKFRRCVFPQRKVLAKTEKPYLCRQLKKSSSMPTIAPFSRPMYVMVKPAGSHCNLRCQYCYYLEKSGLYAEPTHHVTRCSSASSSSISRRNSRRKFSSPGMAASL